MITESSYTYEYGSVNHTKQDQSLRQINKKEETMKFTKEVIMKELDLCKSTFYHYVRMGILERNSLRSPFFTEESFGVLHNYLDVKRRLNEERSRQEVIKNSRKEVEKKRTQWKPNRETFEEFEKVWGSTT